MYSERLYKLNLPQLISFSVGGIILGIIYIALEQGFKNLFPVINGITVGLFVGLMVGLFEIYFFKPSTRHHSFLLMLLYRVAVYLVSISAIILIIVTLNRSIRHEQTFIEALVSEESQTYLTGGRFKAALLFTFLAAVLANFIRLISFKIGRGNLTDFILGVYHKPRLVNRVFMFIQINNANELLKNYNPELYHNLLNEIYRGISIAILNNHGYVYEYVDNQIIAYWKTTKKNQQSRILNCWREIIATMDRNKSYFNDKYGIIPGLVCVAHGGEVVQAEIGELKTEIVFHGDVLNTAGRIMNMANQDKLSFIFSEYIHQNTKKETTDTIKSIGPIELRGKQKPVHLFSMS